MGICRDRGIALLDDYRRFHVGMEGAEVGEFAGVDEGTGPGLVGVDGAGVEAGGGRGVRGKVSIRPFDDVAFPDLEMSGGELHVSDANLDDGWLSVGGSR